MIASSYIACDQYSINNNMKTKLKTQKSVSSRFKITRTGRVLKRKAGQDHFNARETGSTTRKKRRVIGMSKTLHKNIKKLMPKR